VLIVLAEYVPVVVCVPTIVPDPSYSVKSIFVNVPQAQAGIVAVTVTSAVVCGGVIVAWLTDTVGMGAIASLLALTKLPE
jgi:hypothetical protein